MTEPRPGRREGGMKSEQGRAAYWRMNWEAAVQALADLITEHREDSEAYLALSEAIRADPSRATDLLDAEDARRRNG